MAENYFDQPPDPEPKPPTRRRAERGKSNGAKQPAKVNWLAGQEWREDLARSENGKILRTLSNVMIPLRQASVWHQVFAWNLFSNRLMVMRQFPGALETKNTPREISEPDVSNTTDWMQHNGILVASSITAEAIRAVAEDNAWHPVREYLEKLHWDGEPRLDLWLTTYLGAKDTTLNRVFAARWMIGLVARIFEPGCQLDTALILESRQGLKKSTALRVLASPWFTDHVPDLSTKDALEQLQGVWIIELAELTGLSKAETHRIKSFFSTREDRFRPSFGKFSANHPRQCGFAGTINPGSQGYLRDETGGRRFWIVVCGEIWDARQQVDIEVLGTARDQLWAEAVVRYRASEPWWLDNQKLEEDQESIADARQTDDPRERRVGQYIKELPWVRMDQILGDGCLDVPIERWTRSLQTEIGYIMSTLRWKRRRVRLSREEGGALEWRYYPSIASDIEPEIIDLETDIPF